MNGAILYIDDNQDNILVVQRLLSRARPDIRLHTASTGSDGITAAIDTRPALILLDNRLPGTSGEQVLRQLAARPGHRRNPRHHPQRRLRPGDRQGAARGGRRGLPGQAVRHSPAPGNHRTLPPLTAAAGRSQAASR